MFSSAPYFRKFKFNFFVLYGVDNIFDDIMEIQSLPRIGKYRGGISQDVERLKM